MDPILFLVHDLPILLENRGIYIYVLLIAQQEITISGNHWNIVQYRNEFLPNNK